MTASPDAARSRRPAAASPRVAVIGCGDWGRNLVRNFHKLGALAAICDRKPDVAAALAQEYGVQALTVPELLADESIQGVVVATQSDQHFVLASEVLVAGKDVFVEKPLAHSLADAEALSRLAAERGRLVMVGHLLLYHPAFLKVLDLVRTGALGRLRAIASNRLAFGKLRTEESVLWDFAPHDISMMLALADSAPETVAASGTGHVAEGLVDVVTLSLGFAGGVHGTITASRLHPFKEHRLTVVGDGAMAVFDDGLPWPEKLRLYPHRIEWDDHRPRAVAGAPEAVPLEQAEPLAQECAHFIHCLATRERPRTDDAAGLRVLAVLDAAERALLSGRILRFAEPRSRRAAARD